MRDQLVEFLEAVLVQQQLDSLSRRELAFLVLPGAPLGPATLLGCRVTAAQFFEAIHWLHCIIPLMPNDLAKLQGAWTLTALRMDGRDMPASGGIEIDGDRFQSLGMGAEYSGTVEIDETKKPARFDLIFTAGPEAGNRNLGIYRLNGDSWTLCLNMTGQSRPRTFSAAPGSGNALEVFTRGAVAAEPDEPHAAVGEGELVGEWEMQAAFQSGQPLDASMVKTGRRVTSATHTTTYFGKQVFMKATYTTDPSQSPKTIDLVLGSGKTQLGIYDIEGDIMKICFTPPGHPRPTSFDSSGSRIYAIWKRVDPHDRAATTVR